MNEETCQMCGYFRQHFTLDTRKIFRVYCGHCTRYPGKRKRPDTKACESFVLGAAQEEAFASKEYLSKEILQYVLGLELLPEIEEIG